MTSRHRRNVRSLARRSSGLALAVPEVVAHRMMRAWLAGPSPSRRDQDEFHLMGAEKVGAFYESWNAMFLEACRQSFGAWWSPHAALSIMNRGLTPIHRRAVANAARLRKS